MSNPVSQLQHSPSDIVRELLTQLAQGTYPQNNQPWPIQSPIEPSKPDNCITIQDTKGTGDGRTSIDGQIYEHKGLQVRVRSANPVTGAAKAESLRGFMSRQFNLTLTLDGISYNVEYFAKFDQVQQLGTEAPTSKRLIFTFNCTTVITQN